jgi:GTP pyrophosphokinase
LAPKSDAGMPLTGLVSGMDVHYAGCCHPLPGDKIVGIVATGKGVTVHTKECATLETFAATPERFIDVDWDYNNLNRPDAKPGAAGFTGRISVIASNSPAALATLTNAIAKQDGAIANLKIVHRQQDFFEVIVDVEVRDVRHLGQVIAGLRGAAGIAQVERAKS